MRSWKTTLIGYAAAVLNLLANGLTVKNALFSAAIALLGQVTKDYNVTGPVKKDPGGDQAAK